MLPFALAMGVEPAIPFVGGMALPGVRTDCIVGVYPASPFRAELKGGCD